MEISELQRSPNSSSRKTPRTLDDLLAPSSAEIFLGSTLGKTFAVFRGDTGKFGALFSWNELNRVLQQHRFDVPRFRLVMNGKSVSASEFLSYDTPPRRPGTVVPRIKPVELTRCLQRGATLILDGVHEVSGALSALTANLEAELRVHIQANLYAGWRTAPGFDVHWDDHDVIIVQVSGQKHWRVYRMTRAFPLDRDLEPNREPPETPLWEGVLSDGDALYIPRGWWHVALPMDEPTLHLTIGLRTPTGADFLSWFTDRLRANEDVRRDLLPFAEPTEHAAYLERLLQALLREWRPGLIEEFFAHRDATALGSPQLGFPWTVMEQPLPTGSVVKWASPRPAAMASHDGSGEFAIACNGRKWRFAEGARPVLERLLDRKPHAIADMQNLGPSPEMTLAFLRELVSLGLLSVAESCQED